MSYFFKLRDIQDKMDKVPLSTDGKRLFTADLRAEVVEFIETAKREGITYTQALEDLGLQQPVFNTWRRNHKKNVGAGNGAAVRHVTKPVSAKEQVLRELKLKLSHLESEAHSIKSIIIGLETKL